MRGDVLRRCAVRLTSTFSRLLLPRCSTSAPRMEIMCVCVLFNDYHCSLHNRFQQTTLPWSRRSSGVTHTYARMQACKRTPDDDVSHTMYCRRWFVVVSLQTTRATLIPCIVYLCLCVSSVCVCIFECFVCIQLNIAYADMCYYYYAPCMCRSMIRKRAQARL